MIDLGNTCRTPLCHLKLFEEFSDSSVTVTARDKLAFFKVRVTNRWVKPRVGNDFDALWINTHFDGLALVVPAMIHGVDNRLLNGRDRVIEEPRSFGPIRMFDHLFNDDIVFHVAQCIPNLLVDRTVQDFLDNLIASGSLWKDNHINLCSR